jgi:hypothetical protein
MTPTPSTTKRPQKNLWKNWGKMDPPAGGGRLTIVQKSKICRPVPCPLSPVRSIARLLSVPRCDHVQKKQRKMSNHTARSKIALKAI